MDSSSSTNTPTTWLGHLSGWLGGWRFPTVAITIITAFTTLILLVIIAPAAPTGFGAFADAFRTWCFDWQSGDAAPIAPILFMISELVLFVGIVAWLWSAPLRTAFLEEKPAVARTIAGSLVLSSAAITALMILGTPSASEVARALDPTALRLDREAPSIALVDQDGTTVNLADFRGRVVVVTAVYSTCGDTCPMLLGKARRAIAALDPDERKDLHIFAVTLDPNHDTPEVLARVAFNQDAAKPLWYLLSGPPADVEATLDRYDITRRRDPETNRIDHANVFVVIDRQGRLAFRLGLGGDDALLIRALRLVLAEERAASGEIH